MQNIGEEICGEYLNHILGCDFISYNVLTPGVQGEIDVIGIDLKHKIVYVCEVAIHTMGLLYVTNKKADDFNRFYSKFTKSIQYARTNFDTFQIVPMLWSPVVKNSGPKAKYNTLSELNRLREVILAQYDLQLQLFINESYFDALEKLKLFAASKTSEFSSPVMRLFQIEKSLENHLHKMTKNRTLKTQSVSILDN